ncbi:DNA polymerase family B [Apiospora rasikravindrae]|uniref:DNA polymerase n=1 Tax=Apiospora rasikravindrae TaxID=990691 RepID=A0ABR1S1J3_9PEZI
MDVFRVRLNCIDHYQTAPTKYDPQLRNDVRLSQIHKEPKLPIVRVFGSTETGQKVCAHIHGALPYLYVEYDGSLLPEDVGAYIYRLHLSIDHALAVSYRRNVYAEDPKFVARITLAKGIPFYGFFVGYRFYLKIYMLNPMVMTRLAELLQQGVIMKRKFQPYEAHLQYLLQFMTDYNLYGCGYIESRRVSFRAPVPHHDDDENSIHLWHSQTISAACITDSPDLPRASHCSIEVDICVQDILNRLEIKERQLHHDFVERLHPLSPDMKLVHSMAGLWKDETRRRKRRLKNPAPESSPFTADALISMSADPRNSQMPGWIHEEEYREQVLDMVREENRKGDGTQVTFDNFVKPIPFENTVNTLLQSVEDLYPQNLRPSIGLPVPEVGVEVEPASSIIVDDQQILANNMGDDGLFPDDSDEETLRIIKTSADPAVGLGSRSTAKGSLTRTTPLGSEMRSNSSLLQPSLSGSLASSQDKLPKGPDVPKGFPAGIYVSRLKSGNFSPIPMSEQLLETAKEQGLVSKAAKDVNSGGSLDMSMKRPPTPSQGEQQPKRRRVEFSLDQDKTPRTTKGAPHGETPATISQSLHPASSQGSKAKHRSQGFGGGVNQTLNFAVVKDPNDPSTRLRLSQQTSSQQSQDSSYKKQVTMDSLPSGSNTSLDKSLEPPKQTCDFSPHSMPKANEVTPIIDVGCIPRQNAHFFIFATPPPSAKAVLSTMQANNLPDVIYQDAYYSNDKDVPQRMREYAGQEFRLESNTIPYLPDFDGMGGSAATFGIKLETSSLRPSDEENYKRKRRECSFRSWEFSQPPPSCLEVERWWQDRKGGVDSKEPALQIQDDPELKPYLSQIEGATPRNKHGFKYSQKKKTTSVQFEAQYMSTMSLEVHVNTRGKLVPNPEEDEVQCIFWCSKTDEHLNSSAGAPSDLRSGIIVASEDGIMVERIRSQTTVEIYEESSELDLMVRMVEIVRTHDPDILTGYEVHGSSWGYLVERARFKYDYNLCDEFSRMKVQSFGRFGKEADRWGFNTTSTIRVTGRHMINVWRAMRGELNLLQYTMENVVWHLLHRRIPHYNWRTLSDWYINNRPRDLAKLLRYYLTRARLDIEILEANELIPRTSEQARLLGVDFFSVFSRGSQFKVESIMFRIAKPENFILVSPDRKQVGGQNALECLPLVMEPRSAFYNSPLLVLDFQSLYPSVMIAYNYCYSTFLGRINNWRGGASKMGFADYKRQDMLLELLKDHVVISPNGMMYSKAEIRKSLLAKMLTEILETRVMVKSGMKQDKADKTLQQLLNNRQLALKLLANVTYGYTSASFSGRMPCSEIADSIVQTGRETLERAIALIHSVQRWNAEVVYGDTDSLFIYLPGRTKDQAFDIGEEIAKTITDMNPRPIKLKFEKVYHPCLLLAKKRYVGYKYESRDQVKPDFDAKGIETVRRDGTPAEQMIEEKALKILFETADLSQVKDYFQTQCRKIMRGAVSIQDFCFAREVKLGTYSDRGPPPPGALISTKKMLEDARAEPQYGERVPYVVVTGAPGARLIDRCVAPEDLLCGSNSHLSLDAEYYISKNLIPPLERIFNLVGANVRGWYDEMPKVQRVRRVDTTAKGGALLRKATLESYMQAASCLVCGTKTTPDQIKNKNRNSYGENAATNISMLCVRCQGRRYAPVSIMKLQAQLAAEERKFSDVMKLCRSCAGLSPLDEVPCDSKDCPVFYTRMKQGARYRTERGLVAPVVEALVDEVERRDLLEW